MKLYTADAIKEQVHKLLCRDCGETDYCPNCDYRELIDEILDAPTVDAVEVVRCIECRYYGTTRCPVYYKCIESRGRFKTFCSWGERRKDAKID